MKLFTWREIAEVIGITAIVASLVFVGLEMRQSRDIAIGEGNLANAAVQIERNNAISEYSDIWSRGNAGEPLSSNEVVIFQNLVKNTEIHAFMEAMRLLRVDFDEAADRVTAEFSLFLFQNPLARQVWTETEDNRAKHLPSSAARVNWNSLVRTNLARFDQETK